MMGGAEPTASRLWPTWCALAVTPVIAIMVSILAVALYRTAAGEGVEDVAEPTASMIGVAVLAVAVTFAGAALLLAAWSAEPWRERLRLQRLFPRSAWLFVLATPVTLGASTILENLFFDAPSENLLALIGALRSAHGMGAFLLFFSIVVAAPMGEELFFRGYVQGRLERRVPVAVAVTVSSVAFALVHLEPQHIVGVLPFAFWAGYAAWRTQSVGVSIACHAYNNFLSMIGARFASPDLTSWDEPSAIALLGLSVVSVIPFALALRNPGRRTLDDSWKRWLDENLARGCDPAELARILAQHGFSEVSIRSRLADDLERGARRTPDAGAATLGERDYRALARPRLTYDCIDPNVQKIDTDKLQLYVLDGFLSNAECDALIEVIDRHLRPSTTTTGSDDPRFRTSQTSDLSLVDEPIVAQVDDKIARTLGIRAAYSEGIQAQRYDVGQEFKAHTDYFDRDTKDYGEYTAEAGNRTWTFMVFVNDGMEGGSTRFHAIDTEFRPRKGRALIWNNRCIDGRPNPDTLHSGTPVTQGCKIIITKWFREKGTGPVFDR